MASDIDQDINRLYQLPLAEFTSARNALAKRAGAFGARIKALEKPTVPAWAINQLYWRRRKTFDRLVAAASRLHAVHASRLAGKRAEVGPVEAAHAAALRDAANDVREILGEIGEIASPATMSAVMETLQALPGSEPPGRLTRPLKPMGFEALTSLLRAGAKRGPPAEVVPFKAARANEPPPSPRAERAAREAERQKREAELTARAAATRAREAEKIEAHLRAARNAERQAEAALARGRRSLGDAERRQADLESQARKAGERAQQFAEEVRQLQRVADSALVTCRRLEEQLASLRGES